MPGLPASSKGGGMAQGMPDVCKVPAPPAPPIPTPFLNLGQLATATKTCPKVKLQAMEAATEATEIPLSQGDEAGVAGGMISGRNMDKITIKKGSTKVSFGGKAAAHLTSITAHNGSNANMPAGQQIAPSQVKVLVAP
jgi:Domain of unknown function (DUF4150)